MLTRLHVFVDLPPSIRAGEQALIVVNAENVSRDPVELYLRGHDVTCDVIVVDATDTVVWHRFEHAIIPAIVHLRMLAPGEVIRTEITWDTRRHGLPALGTYRVQALLLTDREPITSPVRSLRIER